MLGLLLALGIGRACHRGLRGYAQTLGTLAVARGVTLVVAVLILSSVGG